MMKPRPETRDPRLHRCLSIFVKLQSGRLATVDLANEFNCTQRSIQRDLNALDMAGVALTTEKHGHNWYWRILK